MGIGVWTAFGRLNEGLPGPGAAGYGAQAQPPRGDGLAQVGLPIEVASVTCSKVDAIRSARAMTGGTSNNRVGESPCAISFLTRYQLLISDSRSIQSGDAPNLS